MYNYFYSHEHYQRYIYVKEHVEKLNLYLSKGYTVLRGRNYVLRQPFTFNDICGIPEIKNGLETLIGSEFKEGLIYVPTKKEIDRMLSGYFIIHPKDIVAFKI